MTTISRLVLIVAVAGAVVTGCGSDDGVSSSPQTDAVSPGDTFGVVYPDRTGFFPSFLLVDANDWPLYLLYPALNGETARSEPIEDGEVFRDAAGLLVDDGTELQFVMPSDVEAGSYELCADNDVCVPIEVK